MLALPHDSLIRHAELKLGDAGKERQQGGKISLLVIVHA